MTDLEKLYSVIQQLNNICVPTILIESVTIPIRNAAIVLESIYNNLKNGATNKENQNGEDSPEISIEAIGVGS